MSPWEHAVSNDLSQGELLRDCPIPLLADVRLEAPAGSVCDVKVTRMDVIVVTQSCDLAARGIQPPRADLVAVCPVYSISEWTEQNPQFAKSDRRETARLGRMEGIHLLSSPRVPEDNQHALVAHFRQIVTVPHRVAAGHARSHADRWRLRSPFLEHFSQAFALFFMRVGLPFGIPKYT